MTLERSRHPDAQPLTEPAPAPAQVRQDDEPGDRGHLDQLWIGRSGSGTSSTSSAKTSTGPARSDESAASAQPDRVLPDDEVGSYVSTRIAAIREDVPRLASMQPGAKAKALAEQIHARFGQISEALDRASPVVLADPHIEALDAERRDLYTDVVYVLSKHIKIPTGIPIVDDQKCEREGGDHRGCFLDEVARNRVLSTLQAKVNSSFSNYRMAISNVRFDTLTKSEDGWGFLAEFLFAMTSGGLIGVAMKGLARFKGAITAGKELDDVITTISKDYQPGAQLLQRVASVPDAALKEALVTSSKGLRATLKSSFRGLVPEARGDAAFLDLLGSGLKPIQDDLLTTAPAALDDLELVALQNAYGDAQIHSIQAYQAIVEDMVKRYRASHVSEIGTGRSNGVDYMGRKEPVVVKAGRHTRMAIVEYFDPKYAGAQRVKLYDGKLVPWETPEFVAWVDEDFRDLSRDLLKERMQRNSRSIDATHRTSGFRQFDDWANQVGAPMVTPIEDPATAVTRR